jgi:hypothetical protein
LFREDLAVDTEDTLASASHHACVWESSESVPECTEKLMDHISLSIDIVDHLLMDGIIDLAIEDGYREFIEDEFVFVEVVLLEETRTDEMVSVRTYSPLFVVSLRLQISDKILEILRELRGFTMDQVLDIFSEISLVRFPGSYLEKEGFEMV